MSAPELDFRNTNALWGSVLVETLVRCGVRQAVVSPGSRSTPLTMALARHPQVEAVPVLDERSAAFFALGLAKAGHLPVVLVCTSGTATANYLPAVIEAHESRIPLLVLTADRPPEMRECASGQTIDQQKMYGAWVNWYHELAVPEPLRERLAYLRQTVAHAVERAQLPVPGPVHLNIPLRDPLPPVEDATAKGLESSLDESFFSHLAAPVPLAAGVTVWQRPTTARGLIVAGPAHPRDPAAYVEAVRRFAETVGWPVLADALSPLRHYGPMRVPVIAHYDAILRDARTAAALLPRYVLCLEGWPTSKVLRTWLAGSGAEIVLVAEAPGNRDALHGRTRHLPLPVASLAASGAAPADATYLDAWRAADAIATAHFTRAFGDGHELFEGRVSWLLAQHLPPGTPLFVASSMPVRDVEYFWPLTDRRTGICFNRGANGIDGTLSTALGMAHGRAPAVLLTGDLALLHDTNGFLLRPRLRGSLTILLINNRGGGIFEHLPVSRFEPPFEEFFATPQEVDFARLASAYGVTHERVTDWGRLEERMARLPAAGVHVVEVPTDRKRDAGERRRLLRLPPV